MGRRSPVGTPLTENAIYLIDDVQMAEAIIYQPSESQADLTGYSLVFQDEFDAIGQQPSSDNWTYDLGTSGDGWGNGEVQSYESDMDDAEIIDWDPSDEGN